MTLITVLGEIRELPLAIEDSPSLARFEDFLVERGGLTRGEAEVRIGTLVAALVEGAGNEAGTAMRVHLEAIAEIRATLRVRYAEVIEIFSGRHGTVTELPAHLDEPAFLDLFNQLSEHLEELRDPVGKAVAAIGEAETTDLSAVETGGDDVSAEPELPDVLLDPIGPERVWRPSNYEQQRVELDWYREALRDNPDPQLRAAAEASLQEFIDRFRLPDGWRVRLRRIPEYGYTLEQIRALAARDPNFAARGFEVVIDVPSGAAPWASGPRGASFAPDGVMQGPRGFMFLEYKASWATEPAGFYASEAGRGALLSDMVARARMSLQIPGCGGWGYHTGTPWLDEALTGLVEELRNQQPELGNRIFMLE